MVRIGYTMMTGQAGPRELVGHVVGAERAGFDFSVISVPSFPWLEAQGHAPYAWSVLGAAAQATSRIALMTYVTCPTFRYHPAVIAQKAATMQPLSQGRFRLGLGSGENLNEHIVGAGWPAAHVRLDMLEEAVGIIRSLFTGGYVSHHGTHFDVENARLWDRPDDPDRDAAVARAHNQFRWALGGWKVNEELPGPAGFAQASQHTRPEDVADSIPCGGEVDAFVDAVRPYVDAGFTEIALIQIGGDQQESFLDWSETELLPALGEL
ncbi:TIGR03557 family F420-dependent LLM class oxidoreductase [Streptomyces sp. NBC_00354]|uniref:TIGR03557 family F420-dependent LLM class oxidoreductase n=1 Tax=Streptomyces sp. NBC_00354 TaxID=2975723 RepID=UPI002E26098C